MVVATLYDEYQDLGEHAKLALETLAFLGGSSSPAPFARLLNPIKDQLGLARFNVKSTIEELYYSEVIDGDLNDFRCPAQGIEDIAFAARQRGTSEVILKVVRSASNRTYDPLSEARRTLHSGRPEYTEAVLSHGGYRHQYVRGVERPETLQQFPEPLQLELAENALARQLMNLAPLEPWVRWLMPIFAAGSRTLADLLALGCLLRSDEAGLQRCLGAHEQLMTSYFVEMLRDDLVSGQAKISQRLALHPRSLLSHPLQDMLYALASLKLGQHG